MEKYIINVLYAVLAILGIWSVCVINVLLLLLKIVGSIIIMAGILPSIILALALCGRDTRIIAKRGEKIYNDRIKKNA